MMALQINSEDRNYFRNNSPQNVTMSRNISDKLEFKLKKKTGSDIEGQLYDGEHVP